MRSVLSKIIIGIFCSFCIVFALFIIVVLYNIGSSDRAAISPQVYSSFFASPDASAITQLKGDMEGGWLDSSYSISFVSTMPVRLKESSSYAQVPCDKVDRNAPVALASGWICMEYQASDAAKDRVRSFLMHNPATHEYYFTFASY